MNFAVILYIFFCLFSLILFCFHCFMYVKPNEGKEGKLPSKADVFEFIIAPITFIGYIIDNPSKKDITIYSVYIFLFVIVLVLLVTVSSHGAQE